MPSAYVIGSGPNGLTAAITLAKAGIHTTVIEAQSTIGGGTRSMPLTLPGFVHDVCSAVHPLAVSSSVFSTFPLAEHGLEWIWPATPMAHVLEDGSAVCLEKSIADTCSQLGSDGARYRRWVEPFVKRWDDLKTEILRPIHLPAHPLLLARFGILALGPASGVARALFRTPNARALFAGLAAHSLLPLDQWGSAAVGWVLAIAGHAVGWPIPRGGSQSIANALASYFQSLGGCIVLNQTVQSVNELKEADVILCDVSPRQLLHLAGHRFPERFCRTLEAYRYGPGVFKMDWALAHPIPWKDSRCTKAGTVHLGGSLETVLKSERAPKENRVTDKPFVLLSQPSLFDSTRAPRGQHTAWAYCHVPHGSTQDMTDRIEAQIEQAAPGFRASILATHTRNTHELEKHNANLIGGDINGGQLDLRQLFLRPTRRLYRTPQPLLYLCSASTPPGGGVHGLCGYYAATSALNDMKQAGL